MAEAWVRSSRVVGRVVGRIAADGGAGEIDGVEDLAGVEEEALAGGEEADAAGGPLEEAGAELVFEAADLPAEGRLRDVEALGGAGDVLFFRDGDEVAELGEAHGRTVGGGLVRRKGGARWCARGRRREVGRESCAWDRRRLGRSAAEVRGRARSGWYWTGRARLGHRSRVAIRIYDAEERAAIRRAAQAAAATLATVGARLAAGVDGATIDRWVREDTAGRGGRPSQLGYHGFPAAVCVSRNAVVCHGIPRASEVLSDGDIVNVDVTTELGGFHGDTSATFAIGALRPEVQHLVASTRAALAAGIAAVRPGARLGDVGAAIVEVAAKAGLGVVADYCGHGIGRAMHESPQVSHVGRRGFGLALRPGMVFTIEPMLTIGEPRVRVLGDGWTVVTADGGWSAQFEHTVAVVEDGVEVLSAPPESTR